MEPQTRSLADRAALFIAEGFGTGRIPFAPGTFGTLLGFGWIYLLLLPNNLGLYIAGTVAGLAAAVWLGSRGEELLAKKDPGSIVIDEITALPAAFAPAVFLTTDNGQALDLIEFGNSKLILLPILAFVLFRLFDIIKPLGIARVQKISGGLGLVLDDFLAALGAALLLFLYIKIAG